MAMTSSGANDEGHGDGHPGLVEHGREAPEEPVRAGQRVGGTEADEHHGESESLHDVVDDRLRGHPAADADTGCPRRERHLGQGEQCVTGLTKPEKDHQDHPEDDDHQPQPEEHHDRARPRCRRIPPGRHHEDHHAPISSSRTGFVVRDAAPAMHTAHSHQAPGWRPRRPDTTRAVRLIGSAASRGTRTLAPPGVGGDAQGGHEQASDDQRIGARPRAGAVRRVLGGFQSLFRIGRHRDIG